MLEDAQLFEALGLFAERRFKRREALQERRAVGVDADVPQVPRRVDRTAAGPGRRSDPASRNPSRHGMGWREKYTAYPSRPTSTFTTAGLNRSAASRICVASVAASGGAAAAKAAMSASSGPGSTKGSSPCTLTTRSQSSPRTASAIRSVPETWCAAVRTALPPAARTAAQMRSSSVATRTSATPRTREQRRQTRTTIGSPQMSASALPGRRVDPIRAGMAMTIFTTTARPGARRAADPG